MQAIYFDDGDSEDEDSESCGIIKPEGQTEHLQAVLKCTTGARVQQYLHYILKKHKCIVEIGLGMCTAIKNGMIGSQPTEQEVNNYSPFFCTLHNDQDRLTAANLLRV
jgi:hypothetical protein